MIVGIPGSGKTTLAKKLAQRELSAHSLSCSELLRDVMKVEGIESWSTFDDLEKNERKNLVNCVTEKLIQLKKQHKSIYADAHMLVVNRVSNKLDVALTQADADILDGLIFLDTSPETVQENTKNDNDSNFRKRPTTSLEQIRSHRKKELEAAQVYCERHKVPLHIVNNRNNDYSIEEILERLSNAGTLVPATEDSLHKQISIHIEMIEAQSGPALVLDGDRTFSNSDAFRIFDTALGLRDINRKAFEEHGYSLQSLATVSANWRKVSIYEHLDTLKKVAEEIQPRSEWFKTLSNIPKNVPVFLVTAGVPQLWQSILSNHQLDHIKVIGGTHPYLDKELITHDSKSKIINLLQRKGYWVVAAGDSPIDAPMLNEADLAIVVPDSKGNLPLINELNNQKEWFYLGLKGYTKKENTIDSSTISAAILQRVKFSKFPYLNKMDGIEILCAHSKSKVTGMRRLDIKTEHKKIGALFLNAISNTMPSLSPSNTVVIGIERSGRYLAEGAVDFFDCPLLSAYEGNIINSSVESLDIDKVTHGGKILIPHFNSSKVHTVIYDSVIHTGKTIERTLREIPDDHIGRIHVFCTEINEAALETVERLSRRAAFYCIRISNRKDKPIGRGDMGAKLYGTTS